MAQITAIQEEFHALHIIYKAILVDDSKFNVTRPAAVNQLLSSFERYLNWLFYNEMFASFGGLLAIIQMRPGRRTDYHPIDIRLGQKLLIISIRLYIKFLTKRTKVSFGATVSRSKHPRLGISDSPGMSAGYHATPNNSEL